MKLSAIVIARNEEARIVKCLSSLAWVDEIVVVDNGSIDNTREIAKQHGATVTPAGDVRDFAKLRNLGSEKAKSEWLLYVDADETVTEELRKEIQELDSPPQAGNDRIMDGYEIRRKNYYLGHEWPGDEHILRLMRKDALIKWYGELHETARVKGEIGRLDNPILHDTHRTLEEMVRKTNQWSDTEAKLRFDAHHPPVFWWRLLRVMATGFWNSFIIQGGWKAGTVGWIESIYQAFSMFITYAKLWERQQR